MDLMQLSLAGLIVIGAVNVVTLFKENLDSRIKFAIALVIAFAVSFIPQDISNILLEKLRDAISVALASSGGYKLVSKLNGGSN